MKELKQKEILSKVEQLRKISGKDKREEGADPMDDEYFDTVILFVAVVEVGMVSSPGLLWGKFYLGSVEDVYFEIHIKMRKLIWSRLGKPRGYNDASSTYKILNLTF